MENKGLVMTRNLILCHVWGIRIFDGETRTVDVHGPYASIRNWEKQAT